MMHKLFRVPSACTSASTFWSKVRSKFLPDIVCHTVMSLCMEIHLEKCVGLRQIVSHHGDTPREVCQLQTNSRPPWRYTQRSVSTSDKQQATMEIHLEKCVSLRQIVGHHGDTPREVCQPQTNSRPPWRYTQRGVSASDKQQATMEIHLEKCVSLRQIVGHLDLDFMLHLHFFKG